MLTLNIFHTKVKRWPDATFDINQNSSRSSPYLNFLNISLQVHIQIIFKKKVLLFQTSSPNWKCCKLGTKEFLPFLLIFFQQHIIIGRNIRNNYFFDSFFHELWLNSTLQQLLFQQSYFLFLRWLLVEQTQYRNMDKGCEEIPR